MNRFFALVSVCGMLLIVAAIGQSVSAQSPSDLSGEHISRIRQNCTRAQATLNQLEKSDVLLRKNRGQLYERISTKLMAPLNSRIALNRMEGLTLTAISLEYDNQLASFRSSYQQYDEAMSRTLDIDCVNEPVEFYDSVTDTREKRQRVHGDTVALNALLQSYKEDFEAFVKTTGETAR
jgi:hypothetical protein